MSHAAYSFQARMREAFVGGVFAGKRLKARALKVLLVHAMHANSDGISWVGDETVAGYWGISDRTVRSGKADLIKAGILTDTGRLSGERSPKVYKIELLPAGKDAFRSEAQPPGKQAFRSANALSGKKTHTDRKESTGQPESLFTDKGKKDKSKPSRTPGPAKRQRDPIWDTVVDLFFGGQAAEPHRKRIGQLTRGFRDLEVTPDEIRARLERFSAKWPDITATPDALIKHWHAFAADRPPEHTDTNDSEPTTEDEADALEAETYGRPIRTMSPEQRAAHGLPEMPKPESEVQYANA